jgi:hypothetical protein
VAAGVKGAEAAAVGVEMRAERRLGRDQSGHAVGARAPSVRLGKAQRVGVCGSSSSGITPTTVPKL